MCKSKKYICLNKGTNSFDVTRAKAVMVDSTNNVEYSSNCGMSLTQKRNVEQAKRATDTSSLKSDKTATEIASPILVDFGSFGVCSSDTIH